MSAPCRAHKEKAESAGTPPFLPEHDYLRTKAVRAATTSERPSVGPDRARGIEPARIPQWHPGQYEAQSNNEPRHHPARPETRSNQRLYVPLGSPPSVAVGSSRRVPPTEAARPNIASLKNTSIAVRVKTSRFQLPGAHDNVMQSPSGAAVYCDWPCACSVGRWRRCSVRSNRKPAHQLPKASI